MQKRVLDYQPTFDLKLNPWMNVTANYYPVESAIAIVKDDWQMTVMNDRPQGGSVIKNG